MVEILEVIFVLAKAKRNLLQRDFLRKRLQKNREMIRRFKSIRVYLHVIITFRRHKRLKWL